ncbi:HEXXH motif domain-containing protein, partial [Nonomuraea sp. KM90]|uniref:HEXXH motif domain-containing protein n=1 Tax=Nonomuraea sp. KM90 TaxID=3457428 RepID=UPI003FCE2CCC
MSLRRHRIPDDVLERLAAGAGGAQAAAWLAAIERSRNLLLIRGLLDHRPGKVAERAYDLLARLHRQAPAAVDAVIRYPSVGVWAKRTLRALIEGTATGWEPAQLGGVAAAAAVRAGLPCSAEAPAPGGSLLLPSVGLIELGAEPDALVRLEIGGDGVIQVSGAGRELRHHSGEARPGWSPLEHLTSPATGLDLVVDDVDPYRWGEGDVRKDRLSADELGVWRERFEESQSILRAHHWTLAAETRELISVLTPVDAPPHGGNSASAGDRPGTIALSTPVDGRWLAVTFAHEVQHAKLNAVLAVTELTLPDDRRYYAPWREDPRPLPGLLHGAYAFLGVAGFWRRQREADGDLRAHAEFARWRGSALEATET